MSGGSQAQSGAGPGGAKSKFVLFEPVVLVLLSLATVGTAWCSFEAASWGAVAGGFTNRSLAASRRASLAELQAQQMALLDVLLFSQHINALVSSNDTLARFYADRFRGEAKTAYAAWMATKPFENPDAPPHPFVTNFYQPKLLEAARAADAESQELAQQGGDAGRISRAYILITVLLACSLFAGGTASKFEQTGIRRAVLVLGLASVGFAAVRLWALPTHF